MTCRSGEMSSTDQQRKYSELEKTIISDHLNHLRLSSHICHKYFLQRSNLLHTPPLIFSNALSLTHSHFMSLCCLALSPQLLLPYLNLSSITIIHDLSINVFRKEFFLISKVEPT